ncbi:glutathione S-transferase family protein [Rheinheimera sp.]|uniref:glutathione S-transferase family protein n=1 Tax=Rheinheimera sp. TaxID=1869214 RepID=UPI00307CD00F
MFTSVAVAQWRYTEVINRGTFMYQLFIANKNYSSWSLRPWLLLTELGIAFEEQQVLFRSNDNAGLFKGFAPNAKVPCLHDDGWVVWDSLAIVEYLAERHPGVWPADAKARSWARSASAEMHSGFSALRGYCPFHAAGRFDKTPLPAAVLTDLQRISELWLQGISWFGGPYLAGSAFSAVDAFFAPVVFRCQSYGLPLSEPAATYACFLLQQAGMQLWYRQALAEPYREAEHEQAALGQGKLLADHRISG